MRNLKRALSLAMASVMLLGMMVVGTSAASFQDVDESNDVEAIEVMNAVEVMQGDERGFRPNDPINRNEIAKVMALLLKLTPEDYTYAVTPFTDVPDWAKPYVAACYANGITNGTSATTYSGGNNVTAVQAARMMLRALGYLKNPEDDGEDWVLATVTQASKIGLFDDVNQVGAHNALTRSQVATMALNALESTMVEDKSVRGMEVNTPDGTVVKQPYTPNYVDIEIRYEADKNYAGEGTSKDGFGTQQLCEYLYGTDLKKVERPDDFNRPGSVWKYKGKEIVESPDEPLVVYTKKPSESTIKSDLKGYDFGEDDKGIGVYVNGSDTALYTVAKPAEIRDKVTELGNGTRLEIYADDNEITSIVVIGTYLAQAISDYDAEEDELDITVKASITLDTDETTLDGDDFAIENYKEDDYLLITVADDKVQTVAPATIVSGVTVSAYKDNDSVTAGGTKYDYNALAKGDGSAEGQSDFMKAGGSYTLNKTEYDLILDRYGYVIGVKEASKGDRLSDYLFVKEAAQNGFTVSAKVVFMDGTTKTITVDQINDEDAKNKVLTTVDGSGKVIDKAAAGAGKVMEQAFYTYTENKDGTYDLDSVEGTQYMLPNASIEPDNSADQKIVDQDGTKVTTKPATNKTVFVAKDKAYVGVASAPEVNGDKTKSEYVSWVLDKDGKYVLAVFSSKKGSSSVDASEYIYLLKDKATYGKDSDDNEYWEYDVIMGGKKTTIAASEKVKNGYGVYEITGYTDGYADLEWVTATATGDTLAWKVNGSKEVAPSDITYDDDVLGVDGAYVVLKDAKVFSLKADDTGVKTVSPSALNNESTLDGTKYDVWVVEVSSSDDSVNTVYVVKKG